MVSGDSLPEVRALRNLHDLITTVHSVQDLEEVLQTVAQGVVDVLGFEVSVINCIDAYEYVEAVAVAGDEDACRALKSRRMPLAEFLEEFLIADEWGMLRFVPFDRLPEDVVSSWVPDVQPLDVPDAWHPLDALYAPLHGPTGELLGVLSVDLPRDGMRPGPLSRQVLEMYAVQAGLAIHHAQERDRLRERVRLAGATRTIVDTASRGLDLKRVLDGSFRPLVEGFRCDRMLIRVFDSDEEGIGGEGLSGAGATYPADLVDQLRARLVRLPGGAVLEGTGQDLEVGGTALEVGERVARDCWPEKRTCLVAELGDTSAGLLDDRERHVVSLVMQSLDARSLLLVPLGAGLDCLGYITMIRVDANAVWTEAENEAALEVGREIGRAVDRARIYQRERLLVTELQELDRYKGEMIATITHELKNPLTSIRGHVEMLEDDDVAPASVQAIARNVERLQDLVEDMLLLTKIKDPHRPFVPAPVDLSALAVEVAELLGIQATGRSLVIDATGVDPDVRVWGEREEIARLLTNITGNALKYTDAGGTVSLSVRCDDGSAVFSVTDTGIGISDADLETLFDEFDRSSNPVAHAVPGTGLGLAIVRRIAERHGGEIEVQSTLGDGSTFRVTLPAVALPTEATPSPETASASPLRPVG
jgi:signal transduction histidine kinase